jgi:glyoxylase-like metal-dependent hydrolase (beta-lactamase superfamily II)
MRPQVTGFFDEATYTITYVVAEPDGNRCAIVDPVLDYDPKSGRTSTESADKLIEFLRVEKLEVEWILETHAHADHLSGAPYLREKVGGKTAIGEHIKTVQATFAKVFNLEAGFKTDGSQFDHLFKDGETFSIGALEGRVIHTPGHTPACITYLIGDAGFVGDTLFMPDYGTARCDFPGGDAATLYRSIHKLFDLPDDTRLFMCHDYKAPGRDAYAWETTVADEKAKNIHVGGGASEADFVKMRTERDATLSMPVLILPAVQINIRAGALPPPEDNGVSYVKIPLNAL